jgi:hypothetical protein
MEKALLKGTVVNAEAVAAFPDDLLRGSRRRFKCIACEADAYFNRGWLKQAPHFAAKNHAAYCVEAYYGSRSQHQQFVEADTVVIPIGASPPSSAEDHASEDEGQSRSRILVSGSNGKANATATRGVASVLRELINHPELATSSKDIVVGKLKIRASEFFVPFLQLSEQHANRPIGVWGSVFSAKQGGSIAWLNRGDERVSIEIPVPILEMLKTRYKFAHTGELRGAKFFLICTFDIHLKCRIKDVREIALQVTKAPNEI